MRRLVFTLAACAVAAAAFTLSASADVKITDQAYVRYDMGNDATIQDCSSDATTPAAGGDGSGERQQNEPTAAIDPLNPAHLTAGANDYCTVQTIGDAWAGFYYSSNGGGSWVNSLLPGYPTDTSAAGQASPLHGFVGNSGDPVQAWDRSKHLYYAGIGFNRQRPASGSIWLARYVWPDVQASPTYQFTTIVSRGTPSPLFLGHFEDKVMVETDKGTASPHVGNVYICWARFTANGNNAIEFARSTDGGQTFTIQRISDGVHGNQSCDIAVTRTGMVFVSWRQFEFQPARDTPQKQHDAVVFVSSTNGGVSFTKPKVVFNFTHWDMGDQSGQPALAEQVRYQSCLAGDYTLGACALDPQPKAPARDCGDGPLACQSGYVFGRADSGPRLTADPVAGDGNDAYVVVEATVPGTETATGSTYGTVESGVGSQGSIYFSKTTNGGASWSPASRIDPQAKGHQFYPDLDLDNGTLYVVYHDSRNDNASGPPGTAGDFRTVPFGNVYVDGAAKAIAGLGLETWYSWSTDGGTTWSHAKASAVQYLQNFEQFGNRDVPFFGDYNYVDVVGSKVLMNWTDSRETRSGTDPRYDDPAVTPDDGTDGFDVWQCRVFSGGTWSADQCANASGLDQNIFGLVIG
jgi:hypothetical protein